jgi:perosamine synthetase
MFEDLVKFIKDLYQTNSFIPLHEPKFIGKEKEYLLDVIDSTFVSSVGKSINIFEESISNYTGIKYATATVNCTSAIHLSLLLAGVKEEDEVITQSFNFVAGANAISYCRAHPVFVDIDKDSLTMSPVKLKYFLETNYEIREDGKCWNRVTNKRLTACLPMNSYGFPADVKGLKKICDDFQIKLLEDSAESLGSFQDNKHSGSESMISTLSFNGNKIITTGGGGMILTNDLSIHNKAKHLSTTAKLPHKWEFNHDEIGFNFRMPNLNAALGLAQLEMLEDFITSKREIAFKYQEWGRKKDLVFIKEKEGTKSNYWLNCLMTENLQERDSLLEYTNSNNVMSRPSWTPLHLLEMYSKNFKSDLKDTIWVHERLINLPSTPILNP